MFRKHYLLILFLLLGFLIRIYKLSELPLYGDELTIAYDSYSLLKTGMDSTGEKLPLTFTMGAGRPAGYVYFSIPFIYLFGPSALGVRLLSVLSGVGTIAVIYLLAVKLFSKKVGIISAFLASISPLALSLSRGGFESNFALFLAGLGTYFFISANTKKHLYAFWALCWGLVIHTYPTFKLVLPLFFIPLITYSGSIRKIFKNKFFIVSIIFLGIFSLFSIKETLNGVSEARFLSINIFSDTNLSSEIIQKNNYERSISTLTPALSKYFFNKPFEYAKVFLKNYFNNFSLEYLIFDGDGNPRHNPSETGIIYGAEIVTISYGIYSLIKDKEKKLIMLLVSWILIIPLATALISGPHNLRNSFLLVPLVLISSFGYSLLNKKWKIIISLLILLQAVLVLQRMYFLASHKFSSFWSESAKLASVKASEKSLIYKNVLISDKIDNIEFAYPLYERIDPNSVISQNKHRVSEFGVTLKKFGNVFIGNFSKPKVQEIALTGTTIYIGDKSESKNFEDYELLEASDKTGGIIFKSFQ